MNGFSLNLCSNFQTIIFPPMWYKYYNLQANCFVFIFVSPLIWLASYLAAALLQ